MRVHYTAATAAGGSARCKRQPVARLHPHCRSLARFCMFCQPPWRRHRVASVRMYCRRIVIGATPHRWRRPPSCHHCIQPGHNGFSHIQPAVASLCSWPFVVATARRFQDGGQHASYNVSYPPPHSISFMYAPPRSQQDNHSLSPQCLASRPSPRSTPTAPLGRVRGSPTRPHPPTYNLEHHPSTPLQVCPRAHLVRQLASSCWCFAPACMRHNHHPIAGGPRVVMHLCTSGLDCL